MPFVRVAVFGVGDGVDAKVKEVAGEVSDALLGMGTGCDVWMGVKDVKANAGTGVALGLLTG